MKKFTIALLVISQAASSFAADTSPGSGYPYLAEANCRGDIRTPPNTSISYNKECNVGFVFPQTVGSMKLIPRPSEALRICPAFREALDSIQKYNVSINKLLTLADNTSDEALRERYYENIKSLRALQSGTSEQFEKLEAMRINVTFKNEAGELVEAANALNPESGIQFQEAPVAQGRLSYNVVSAVDPSTLRLDAILKTSIPGNNSVIEANQGSVDFAGSLQGEMILSLAGACPFIDFDSAKNPVINKEKMSQTIVANYTYAIPSQTSAGYSATLNITEAFKVLKDHLTTKSETSRHEVLNSFVEGNASQVLDIRLWTAEGDTSMGTDTLSSVMKLDMGTNLTDRFLKFLETNGFLQSGVPDYEAATTTSVDRTYVRQVCHSSSKWFGIKRSSSCANVPYTVKVPVTSSSQQWVDLEKNTNLTFSDRAEINSIIYRTHTSTFELN